MHACNYVYKYTYKKWFAKGVVYHIPQSLMPLWPTLGGQQQQPDQGTCSHDQEEGEFIEYMQETQEFL